MVRRIAGFILVVGVLFAAVAVLKRQSSEAPGLAESAATSAGDRDRIRRFWEAYRRATEHRIAGRLEQAAESYAEALDLNPEHQDALYYLGNTRFDLGELVLAEQMWQRLVEVDPTNARGHSQLGMLYSCVGAPRFVDLSRATAEYQRASAINREETGPLLHLAEIGLLQGQLETARSYLDSVIGSNYSSVEAHFYLGYIAWQAGTTTDAEERLTEAAGHARPSGPSAGVPGEGDTRSGEGPMVTSLAACRPTRAPVEELRSLDDGDVRRRAGQIYRDFDELLKQVRRVLPTQPT